MQIANQENSGIEEAGVVLIVDDESDMREMLRDMVESMGFTVQEAADGLLGLAVLQHHTVDVIITDLTMPNMTGLEFFTKLRDTGYQKPVIILTGHGSKEAVITALRLGVFDFLEKPFLSDKLKVIVTDAMAYSRIQDEVQKTFEANFPPDPANPSSSARSAQIQALVKIMALSRRKHNKPV